MVSARVRVALGVLLGLGIACAPATRPGTGDTEDRPQPSDPRRPAVTAEDIERTPGQSIEELLMTRFPGVIVTRAADGGLVVRIRGAVSIHGSSEPLYVIDGVPIPPGPGGSLSGINPYDIESIEVLTDPASTTMWGVRGANGVVVIKTKQSI